MRKNAYTIDIDNKLGVKVMELRVAAGLSREQLAERIGVTHQQLQKYEKGLNRISAGRLMAIAKALKTTASYLLDETGVALVRHRASIELIRNFNLIKDSEMQEQILSLVRCAAKTIH